jgi:hypothetical protein
MEDNVSANAPLIEWGLGRFQRYFVHPLLLREDENSKNEKVYRNGEQLRFGVEIFPAFSSESTLENFFEDFKMFGSKICLHYELVDEKSGLLIQECIDSDHPPSLLFSDDGVKILCTTAVKVPDRYLGRELSFITTLSVSWARLFNGKDDTVGEDESELRGLVEKQKLRTPRIAPRIFSKEIIIIQVLGLSSAFDLCNFGAERSSLLVISAENSHPTRDLVVEDLIVHLGNVVNDTSYAQCERKSFGPHFDVVSDSSNGAALQTADERPLCLLKQRFEVDGDKLFSLVPVWTNSSSSGDSEDVAPSRVLFPVRIQPGEVFSFSFVASPRHPSSDISGHYSTTFSVSWYDSKAPTGTGGVDAYNEGLPRPYAAITTTSSVSWSFDTRLLKSPFQPSKYPASAAGISNSINLAVTLSAPDIAIVGRIFTITITIMNPAKRVQAVGSSGSCTLRGVLLGVRDTWHSKESYVDLLSLKSWPSLILIAPLPLSIPHAFFRGSSRTAEAESVETVRYVCLDPETFIGSVVLFIYFVLFIHSFYYNAY